jgi:hypothetical protein
VSGGRQSLFKLLMGFGKRIRPCIAEKLRGRVRKHTSGIAVSANAIQRTLSHARKGKESSVSYDKITCYVSREARKLCSTAREKSAVDRCAYSQA